MYVFQKVDYLNFGICKLKMYLTDFFSPGLTTTFVDIASRIAILHGM